MKPRTASRSISRTLVTAVAVAALWRPVPVNGQTETVATQVLIRAVSHDAKIIGSGVGGARIVIQDVATGAVLAEGLQTGSTGNTDLIMKKAHARDSLVYATDGAAHFLAAVDLVRPTTVDITAYGPLGTPHATQMSSKRMLLIPGKDVLGEGVILELNGFTVEILSVEVHDSPSGGAVHLEARVTMLCGCPTEPGGLWDSDDYELTAALMNGEETLVSESLEFAGTTSTFRATLGPVPAESYTLRVIAADAARGNFGIADRVVVVSAD